MSRPRFLADHDLDDRIIAGLLRRQSTIDCVRLRNVLPAATPDLQVLAHAATEGRIVVSHDVTTMTAAAKHRIAAGESMAGLILVRQSLPLRTAIDDLLLLWTATEAEEWPDRILFLPV